MQGNHPSFASLSCGYVFTGQRALKVVPANEVPYSLFTDIWKKYMGG